MWELESAEQTKAAAQVCSVSRCLCDNTMAEFKPSGVKDVPAEDVSLGGGSHVCVHGQSLPNLPILTLHADRSTLCYDCSSSRPTPLT